MLAEICERVSRGWLVGWIGERWCLGKGKTHQVFVIQLPSALNINNRRACAITTRKTPRVLSIDPICPQIPLLCKFGIIIRLNGRETRASKALSTRHLLVLAQGLQQLDDILRGSVLRRLGELDAVPGAKIGGLVGRIERDGALDHFCDFLGRQAGDEGGYGEVYVSFGLGPRGDGVGLANEVLDELGAG